MSKRTGTRGGGLLLCGAALTATGLLLMAPPAGAMAAVTHHPPAPGTALRMVTAAGSSAITTARPLSGNQHRSGTDGYTCVVQVQKSKTVIGYLPLQLYHTARSYSMHWLINPYSVTHARYLAGKPTFQVQLCAVGGGNTWNDWNQTFDGLGEMLAYTSPKMLGWKYATTVDSSGNAHMSLNFSVNVGVATIGGSDTIDRYGTHTGNPGVNTNISWPHSWNQYNGNRVNVYYGSPATYWWDGTTAFEGNTGSSLYEFVTPGTMNFSYGGEWTIIAHCHMVIPNCRPFS